MKKIIYYYKCRGLLEALTKNYMMPAIFTIIKTALYFDLLQTMLNMQMLNKTSIISRTKSLNIHNYHSNHQMNIY